MRPYVPGRWSVFIANHYRLVIYSAVVLNAGTDLEAFDQLYQPGAAFTEFYEAYKHVSIKPWRASDV